MGEPQPILTPLTSAAIFIVATVDEGGEAQTRELLADLAGLSRSVGFRVPAAALTVVAGVGAQVWPRLYGTPKPEALHEFHEIRGRHHTAPATPGDVLFHIRAFALDVCFELAAKLAERLRGAATIVDETHGFRYFENRDLLGFVDGTENPAGAEAVEHTIDADGGSYVVVQKYVHALTDWNAVSIEEQQRAVGRTKLDDYELPELPANSHVELTTIIDDDGAERQISRFNMPFGSVKDDVFGTYFIGYAADPAVTERMLDRMFLGTAAAAHDRLLDFSTATTGSLFYAPPADFLEAAPAPQPVAAPQATPAVPNTDGSLHIGSLKEA